MACMALKNELAGLQMWLDSVAPGLLEFEKVLWTVQKVEVAQPQLLKKKLVVEYVDVGIGRCNT